MARYSLELIHGEKTHSYFFSSFVDWVDTLKADGIKPAHYSDYDVLNNKRWRGRTFKSWKEVYECASTPWLEGMKMYEEAKEALSRVPMEMPTSIKRKRRWNEGEGEVDVDRFIAGEALCFEDCFRHRVEGSPVITIAVDMINSGCYSPESLFWNSAAAVAMVDLLEAAGYCVEVIGYSRFSGIYHTQVKNFFSSVVLKEAGDPLDCSSLISGLSAFAFRTLAFMAANLPKGSKPTDSGYGYPAKVDTDSIRNLHGLNGTVFNIPNMASQEAAIAMCVTILMEVASKLRS